MQTVLFFSYIALISTVGTVLCLYDKLSASKNFGTRVSERMLCLCSAAGGALCMLLCMLWIRHKTQHTFIIVLTSTAALLWTLVYTVAFLAFVL